MAAQPIESLSIFFFCNCGPNATNVAAGTLLKQLLRDDYLVFAPSDTDL